MPRKAKLQEATNVIQEAGVHLTKEEKAKTNINISSNSVTRKIQIKPQKELPLYSPPEWKKI